MFLSVVQAHAAALCRRSSMTRGHAGDGNKWSVAGKERCGACSGKVILYNSCTYLCTFARVGHSAAPHRRSSVSSGCRKGRGLVGQGSACFCLLSRRTLLRCAGTAA